MDKDNKEAEIVKINKNKNKIDNLKYKLTTLCNVGHCELVNLLLRITILICRTESNVTPQLIHACLSGPGGVKYYFGATQFKYIFFFWGPPVQIWFWGVAASKGWEPLFMLVWWHVLHTVPADICTVTYSKWFRAVNWTAKMVGKCSSGDHASLLLGYTSFMNKDVWLPSASYMGVSDISNNPYKTN